MLSLSSGSVFWLLEPKVYISTSWSNNHSVVESFRSEEFQRVIVTRSDFTLLLYYNRFQLLVEIPESDDSGVNIISTVFP
jgi:hypothetical protein